MRWRSFRKLPGLIIVGAMFLLPSTVTGQAAATAPNAKDPALAIALGLAVPGLGHLYLGETGNAVRYGVPAIAGAAVALSRRQEDAATELGAFFWLGSYALSLFDLPEAIRRQEPPKPGPIVAVGVARGTIAVRVSLEQR